MDAAQLEPQKATTPPGARPGPAPDRFFETLTAYQHSAALKAAIDLDLFTAIGNGHNTVSALAKRIVGSERGVRILCDCLAVIGFLTKEEKRYGLTADSAVFLDKKSHAYAGSAANFLNSPAMMEGFKDLAKVVRSGHPLADHPFSGVEHPIWIEFARSMAPLLTVPARETAKLLNSESELKLLDIAAGHGMFGIAVAQHNRRARIVALDFASVLTVAAENAKHFGVADRYSLLPGSALEVDFGTGFDAVLVPNLMHSLDPDANKLLLKKVYDALAPKGCVVVVEFVANEDRVSPRLPALFALMMLANNSGGDAFTISEHQAMLSHVGFVEYEVHPLAATPFTAVVARKESEAGNHMHDLDAPVSLPVLEKAGGL